MLVQLTHYLFRLSRGITSTENKINCFFLVPSQSTTNNVSDRWSKSTYYVIESVHDISWQCWFGLWCSLQWLSTIFQLNCGGQVNWWMKPERTTDLSYVTDTLYHIILYWVQLVVNGVRTHNVSGDKSAWEIYSKRTLSENI